MHVPYRGGQGELDLLAGRIDFMLANLPNVLQPVAVRQYTALAVAAPQRYRHLPEVPTLVELGFPVLSDSWFGVVAPAGLRPDTATRHSAAWLAALDRPEIRADLERRGLEVLGIGPTEFATRLRRDRTTYVEVVRAANIKPE